MSQTLRLEDAPITLQKFVRAYVKADLLPFAIIYVYKTSNGAWEVTTLPWGVSPRDIGDLLPLAMYAGLFDNSYHFALYKWTKSPFLQNWMKHCKFLEKKSSRSFPYIPVTTEVEGRSDRFSNCCPCCLLLIAIRFGGYVRILFQFSVRRS